MGGMNATVMSILMLAGFALTGGGLYLLVRRKERKQGLLMLLTAAVMFANVAIWAVPVK
jgi:LPXTG-motif cell wall-anchored protein